MGGGGQSVFLPIEFHLQLEAQVVYLFMFGINTKLVITHSICQIKWHYFLKYIKILNF